MRIVQGMLVFVVTAHLLLHYPAVVGNASGCSYCYIRPVLPSQSDTHDAGPPGAEVLLPGVYHDKHARSTMQSTAEEYADS
jgi:hypothetical protein